MKRPTIFVNDIQDISFLFSVGVGWHVKILVIGCIQFYMWLYYNVRVPAVLCCVGEHMQWVLELGWCQAYWRRRWRQFGIWVGTMHRVYKIYRVELQWLDNDVRFCIYQKQINPNKLECVKLIKTLMTCLPLQDHGMCI